MSLKLVASPQRTMMHFSLVLFVSLLACQSNAISYDEADCAPGGSCSALRLRFADLIGGRQCWRIHERGVCARVCLRSLRALQARRGWSACARHCAWPQATLAAAADWTKWCESLAEPDDPPDIQAPPVFFHNATAAHVSHVTSRTFSAHVFVRFMFLIIAFVVSIVLLRVQRVRLIIRSAALAIARRRNQPRQRTGILDHEPDRSEIRRIAHGARRHLKAMRSSLD